MTSRRHAVDCHGDAAGPHRDAGLRAALAPLREWEPTPEAAARAVAAVRRPARARSRLRVRGPLVVATGVAGAVALVVAMPALRDEPASVADARTVLLAAADVAEDPPRPVPVTAVRYVELAERATFELRRTDPDGQVASATATATATRRAWISSRDALRDERSGVALAFAGDAALRARLEGTPWRFGGPQVIESDDTRGDGPTADVHGKDLPADPAALRRLLERGYSAGPFAPGFAPTAVEVRGMVAMGALVRLAHGYTTPAVRGALFRVLAGIPELRAAGEVVTADGRRGTAIEIPPADEVPTAPMTWFGDQRIIFDPQTAELLEWDSPGASYWPVPAELDRLPRAAEAEPGEAAIGAVRRTLTFRRAAGVDRLGQRP